MSYSSVDSMHLPEWVKETTTDLPVTVVNDKVVKSGAYLTDDEFAEITGVSFKIEDESVYTHECVGEDCSCGRSK